MSPRTAALWIRALLLSVFLMLSCGRADVVINEVMTAASQRLLRWDADGIARLGTGPAWYESAYDDSTWQSGAGPFGFGSFSNGSFIPGTRVDTQMIYLTPTLYLRKVITVSGSEAAKTDQLQFLVEYNDGCIIYVNGKEVARRRAGPQGQFQYHDQGAQDPDLSNASADNLITTETLNLGPANQLLIPGQNIVAVHALNLTSSSTNFLFRGTLRIGGIAPTTLVSPTETWRYLPGVVEPSGGLYDPSRLFAGKLNVPWARVTYDDSNWNSGVGPLGAGTGGLGTNVSGVIGVTPSIYLRHVFNVSEGQATDSASMQLIVDYNDGFIAYINGVEVARSPNMQSANTFTPFNAVPTSSRSFGTADTFTIDSPADLLVPGANVLAIQVHNVTAANSNIAIKADLRSQGGVTLVANNALWKYFVGTEEPVPSIDDSIEDNPDPPDSVTDWIELYNDGSEAVSLGGWRLTDDPTEPAKWVFPETTIPAGGYLLVICDGADVKDPPSNGYLHTNFKLARSGEHLALRDSSGNVVQFFQSLPPGSPFHSYGRNDSGVYVYFDTATPGAPNSGTESSGFVAPPAFSSPGGFYTGSLTVTLNTTTPGASIRYTLDGSEPTEGTGLIYNGGILLNSSRAIRARAFKDGMIPSEVATQTYLVNEPNPRPSLPAVTLAGDQQRSLYRPYGVMAINGNVVGTNYSASGQPWNAAGSPTQYNNVSFRGRSMERPVVWQMLYPGNAPGFSTPIGLRIAGSQFARPRYILSNQNRQPGASPGPNDGSWTNNFQEKPSMNFFMRGELGEDPLEFPVFPGSEVVRHSTLRLRAGHNDVSNPFIIDELMRRLYADTGQVSSLGIMCTLYVNGVYKGYFNLCQRVREDFLQEAYGSSLSWDVIQRASPADGDMIALQELVTYARNNNQASLANFEGTKARLDVVNFVDYLLVNLYGVTGDWPHNNWIAARERSANGRFRFYVWDAEGAFGGFSGNVRENQFVSGATGSIVTNSPGSDSLESTPRILHTLLRASPEYRLIFADRIQKHFFNQGALTDAAIMARKNALRTQMAPFIGGFNDSRFNNWISGQGNSMRFTTQSGTPSGSIINSPSRRRVLLDGYIDDTAGGSQVQGQFVTQGLWPATKPPVFQQHGGDVASNFQLNLTNPNGTGTIYYTVDGRDPRAEGGAIQGTVYSGPIAILQTTLVRARVRSAGGEWSALNEALFSVPNTPSLIISEVMYHPPDLGGVDGNEFEFIELKNVGALPVNVSGMRFADGVNFTFEQGTIIPPGGFAVIVKNPTQFAVKYPGVPVTGSYGSGSSLSNGGETLTLVAISGAIIASFTYDDQEPWPLSADGGGYSLVPVDPNANPDPNNPTYWRASTNVGGSPGADDPPSGVGTILISEIVSNPAAGGFDAIELLNPGNGPVNVGNWWLSDSVASPKKFRIPPGVSIPAGGYIVFTAAEFNAAPGDGVSFDLSSSGGTVVLSSADASGDFTGYSHVVTFGASPSGVSLGEVEISPGQKVWRPLAVPTLGGPNAGPLIGPVVITEVLYNPNGVEGDEFIEIYNSGTVPIPLYDPTQPENTWRILGVDFAFPQGVTMGPGEIVVVSSLTPEAFRSKYSVPAYVQVFQFAGNLGSNGTLIALQRPNEPGSGQDSTFSEVDSVSFDGDIPWPSGEDDGVVSLERVNWKSFGAFPSAWRASSEVGGTPGKLTSLNLEEWTALHFNTPISIDPALSSPDIDADRDGMANLVEFALGRDPLRGDAESAIIPRLVVDGGNPYLAVEFRRSLSAAAVRVYGDTSGDLVNWNLGAATSAGSVVTNADGTETVILRDTVPYSAGSPRFMRLRMVIE